MGMGPEATYSIMESLAGLFGSSFGRPRLRPPRIHDNSHFDIWSNTILIPGKHRPRICILDGQGGGIGYTIVKRIKQEFGERFEILALGTNSIATAQMLKAKANRGATGENAIRCTVRQADVIVAPIATLLADAMLGEVTAGISEAIGRSPALKLLVPLTQEPVEIIGIREEPLPHLVEIIIRKLREIFNNV